MAGQEKEVKEDSTARHIAKSPLRAATPRGDNVLIANMELVYLSDIISPRFIFVKEITFILEKVEEHGVPRSHARNPMLLVIFFQ